MYNILVWKRGDTMRGNNGFCQVAFMRCDSAFECGAEAISALPFGECEKQRLAKIKNDSSRRNSLCALLCLESLLRGRGIDASSTDLTIVRSENGKPHFSSLPLHFSISHSKDLCAVALSDSSIGIDVEFANTGKDILAISERFFALEEHLKISQSNSREEDFLLTWTKKEALAKLSGLGLSSICSRKLPQSSAYNFKCYRLELDEQIAYLSLCSERKIKHLEYDKNKEITLYEIQN